jgi:putative membrane protein
MLKKVGVVFTLVAFAVCGATAQQPDQAQPRQGQSAAGQTSSSQSDMRNKTGTAGKTGKKTKSASKQSTAKNMDSRFAMEAAQGGLAEVSMARVALERAANPDVKQFAQRMIDDHTKANGELMQIAQSKNMTLPTGPNAKQRATQARMETLSGTQFEREYLRHEMKDHDKTVKLFERESTNGTDADLQALAARTLPTLHEHEQLANNTAEKVGAGTMAHKKGKKGDNGATASGTPKQ